MSSDTIQEDVQGKREAGRGSDTFRRFTGSTRGRLLCGGIVAFLYLWLVVDVRLLCGATKWFPLFLTGRPFAAPFMARPGGPVEYVAAFLAQWQYHGWPGALVVAAVVVALGYGTFAWTKALSSKQFEWAFWGPTVLALCVCGRYGNHLASLLALTLMVWVLVVYERLPGVRPWQRIGVFAALHCLLCYGTGGVAMFFACLCAIADMRRRRGLLVVRAVAVLGIMMPLLVGPAILGVPVIGTYTALTPIDATRQPAGVFVLAILFAGYVGLTSVVAAGRRAGRGGSRLSRALAIRPGIAVLAVAGALAAGLDRPTKQYLSIARLARERRWKELLRVVRGYSNDARLETIYHTNQALYHTGQLPEAMFTFPQVSGGLLLGGVLDAATPAPIHYLRADMYFDLGDTILDMGMVNEAEHEANEALTRSGPRPMVLRQLAMANIAKGRTAAARVYLRALARDVVHKRTARRMLGLLAVDATMATNPRIRKIQTRMCRGDHIALGADIVRRAEVLLDTDPSNRMAFEYMMCQCLLDRRLDVVAANLDRLTSFGYDRVPRHFQEAAVLHQAITGGTPNTGELSIDADIMQAYGVFARMLQPYHRQQDSVGGRRALAADFGDSYFYYYAFSPSTEAAQ